MAERKLRSRSYPAVALAEAVDLLRKLPLDRSSHWLSDDAIAMAWGHASANSGQAIRKLSALGQFGLLIGKGGLYSPTALADRMLQERTQAAFQVLLREACRNPALYQDVFQRYESVGRVPVALAPALVLDHGIQESVQDEVAGLFMSSAVYSGILDDYGVFTDEYFDETHHPRPSKVAIASPAPSASGAEQVGKNEVAEPQDGQKLSFFLTEGKLADLRVPGRLNEQDITLLRAQIDFLELQVRLNRPGQAVRLDVVRGDRRR